MRGSGTEQRVGGWSRRNATLLGMFMGLVFMLLIGRLVSIQAAPDATGPAWARSAANRSSWKESRSILAEQGRRGAIHDREGRLLAVSWFEHQLVVDPTALKRARRHRPGIDREFVTLLPVALEQIGITPDVERIREAAYKTERWVEARGEWEDVRWRLIASGIEPLARRELGAMLEGLPAWSFQERIRRTYPFGAITGQLVGLIGMSGREHDGEVAGRVGLELFLERALAGEPGRLTAVQDAAGAETVIADAWARSPRPGCDVALTVDAEIQRFVVEALGRGASESGPEVSSAVVLDVRTGEILGAASWPTADPNDLGQSEVQNLKLAAFQSRYAPGSTVKPLLLGWAFAHGVLDPEERFDCGGSAGRERIGPRTVIEYSPNPGLLTPREILMRSSNVGAARIAVGRLGLSGMYTLLDALGWGDRPGHDDLQAAAGIGPPGGIAFPYVASGFFTRHDLGGRPFGPSDPPLSGPLAYTEVAFALGYEIALSPLALARAYTCLARAGELIEPRLIREISWEDGSWRPPVRTRRVFSEAAVARVREGMLLAVENSRGTAHKTRSDHWTTAAKTGTAQVTTPDEVGRRSLYNAWFCCLAPASSPRIVVVVHHQLRHRPGAPYTGGAVSGPVGKEIIERTLEYLGVPPDRERVAPEEQGR